MSHHLWNLPEMNLSVVDADDGQAAIFDSLGFIIGEADPQVAIAGSQLHHRLTGGGARGVRSMEYRFVYGVVTPLNGVDCRSSTTTP